MTYARVTHLGSNIKCSNTVTEQEVKTNGVKNSTKTKLAILYYSI